MTSYVALLRGVNVGGRVLVPMADLRALFEAEGFVDVKTLLQSGNVIFKSNVPANQLETTLEEAVAKKFGRHIDFFVRDRAAWHKMVAKNPFSDQAKNDPGRLIVACLKGKPTIEALAALQAAIVGREYFKAGERCLYLVYPDGMGKSKLTNAVMDRKLGARGTARNWNTVLKIAALL